MNFFNRFQGVFLSPQLTMKSISEKPIWVDALVILLIFIALISYMVYPFSQQDKIQAIKSSVKIQERLGEEKYNETIERMENPPKLEVILTSFMLSPISYLIGFLLSSLVILGLGRLFSTEGKYVQVLSAFLHANFIDKILGNAIRLIPIFSKKSVAQTSTGFAIFFPHLEASSPSFVILSQFDFFQLWLFGILGFGLAHIFKIEFKKALIISYGFWFLKSLLYVAINIFVAGAFQ